jgi:hypothetical protein
MILLSSTSQSQKYLRQKQHTPLPNPPGNQRRRVKHLPIILSLIPEHEDRGGYVHEHNQCIAGDEKEEFRFREGVARVGVEAVDLEAGEDPGGDDGDDAEGDGAGCPGGHPPAASLTARCLLAVQGLECAVQLGGWETNRCWLL